MTDLWKTHPFEKHLGCPFLYLLFVMKGGKGSGSCSSFLIFLTTGILGANLGKPHWPFDFLLLSLDSLLPQVFSSSMPEVWANGNYSATFVRSFFGLVHFPGSSIADRFYSTSSQGLMESSLMKRGIGNCTTMLLSEAYFYFATPKLYQLAAKKGDGWHCHSPLGQKTFSTHRLCWLFHHFKHHRLGSIMIIRSNAEGPSKKWDVGRPHAFPHFTLFLLPHSCHAPSPLAPAWNTGPITSMISFLSISFLSISFLSLRADFSSCFSFFSFSSWKRGCKLH